jgi:hypothetical protein
MGATIEDVYSILRVHPYTGYIGERPASWALGPVVYYFVSELA